MIPKLLHRELDRHSMKHARHEGMASQPFLARGAHLLSFGKRGFDLQAELGGDSSKTICELDLSDVDSFVGQRLGVSCRSRDIA
jgi:hypothetical protein